MFDLRRLLDPRRQLQRSDKERTSHIAALSKIVLSETHQNLFDHLYSCLSIIDSKSSSMLGFNSIILAVFAILMTGDLPLSQSIVANVGMATILLSALLLLSVVWIHWSSTQECGDPDRHANVLLAVRDSRTIRYRVAWLLAVASVLALCVLLFLRFVSDL